MTKYYIEGYCEAPEKPFDTEDEAYEFWVLHGEGYSKESVNDLFETYLYEAADENNKNT